MRLALLGPAEGQPGPLEAAARFVLSMDHVDRAVYLGVDGALDPIIKKLATELVGENPSADAVWSRAARACLRAPSAQIDAYIAAERALARLRVFEALPNEQTRAVEMLGSALAVMIFDKGLLNEEDMLPARILSFGKSKTHVIKSVGKRWFLSPGSYQEGGLMVLEDTDDGVSLLLLDAEGTERHREHLSTHRTTRLHVGSASG
jgi:hypothetical protein